MMVTVRRLLSAIVALALTHFGVVASGAVHAHDGDVPHGVHAVELHGMAVDHGHAAHHHHHHADLDDAADEGTLAEGDDGTDMNEGGTIVHAHSGPQFAPSHGVLSSYVPVAVSEPLHPPIVRAASTWSGAPPFRPPRAAL